MGIRNLWLALSPACQTRTLTELAIREGFEPSRRTDRCLRIAIDSSIWMNQAQTAITYQRGPGTQTGENAALRILFFRLCQLLTLPIVPIFVFDGPKRASIKRGVQVKKSTPHALTGGFKAFIEAFGFYWHEAPGEADADLAELSKRDFVDAVISEDSDVMVYGAKVVIRMDNTQKRGDLVDIFNSQKIETEPRVCLTHHGLFFMAILCGGDYDKTGLSGCGWKTALLLSQTPIAKSLFVAASTSPSRECLEDFLKGWRNELVNILTKDPDGHLGRRYPALAKIVQGQAFPSVDILLLYAQPVSSWKNQTIPNTSAWTLTEPDLPKIALLAEKYFSWESAKKNLANRFRENVWPGIVVRFFLALPSLDEQLVLYTQDKPIPGNHFSHADIFKIRQEKIGPGGPATHSNVTGYTIEVSTTTLLRSTGGKLESDVHISLSQPSSTKALIWIPAPILSTVLPAFVKAFRLRRHLPCQPDQNFYHPVLPLFLNFNALIPLETEQSAQPGPGPSTVLARSALSHGDSKSDPIVLTPE